VVVGRARRHAIKNSPVDFSRQRLHAAVAHRKDHDARVSAAEAGIAALGLVEFTLVAERVGFADP
jgi:hypothetical protein